MLLPIARLAKMPSPSHRQYYQQVRPKFDKRYRTDGGETGSLMLANQVLGERYPKRLRPYLAHGPKVVMKSIHQEVAEVFAPQVHQSRLRRFRESSHGDGSVSFLWLASAYQVRYTRT